MTTASLNPTSAEAATVVVCRLDQLTPELGVAAIFGEQQVAIFRLADDSVYAVQNQCPFTGAFVMSRGITGSRGDIPTIASPLLKQVFSLLDGTCLATMDKEPLPHLGSTLRTYPVTVREGNVVIDLIHHA
jgi:nitrite reductase (NADH) small subunit